MRNKFGKICMVLGATLIFGAMSLLIHNQLVAAQAERASVALLPRLVEEIEQNVASADMDLPIELSTPTPIDLLDPSALEMTEVEIDGYSYIGYLSIPELDLELPVMADWDYARLKIAPCRYIGSVRGENMVILAHNYTGHFGRLSELSVGDSVSFTDVNGLTTNYEVAGLDILAATAVEEMTSGDFDLTLFTCTYGGKSRVTVYCNME